MAVQGAPCGATRWEGNRTIDYCISNLPETGKTWTTKHEKIKDHMIVEGTLALKGRFRDKFELAKPRTYAKPPQVTAKEWRRIIGEEWLEDRHTETQPTTTAELDKMFEAVNAELEKAMDNATERATGGAAAKPKGLPPKGAGPSIKKSPVGRPKALPTDTSCQALVMRNTLGRALEVKRQRRARDGPLIAAAEKKLRRAKKINFEKPLVHEITRIEKHIAHLDGARYRARMDKWKDKMALDDRAAFRWLRGGDGPPITSIYSEFCPRPGERGHREGAPGSDATESIDEVIHVLGEHWQQVWQRPPPDMNEIQRHIEQEIGPRSSEEKWDPVTGQELKKAAEKQKGGAASVDGWLGDEIANFSDDMWERIAEVFAAAERIGTAPTSLANARQVHIPKAGNKRGRTERCTPQQ